MLGHLGFRAWGLGFKALTYLFLRSSIFVIIQPSMRQPQKLVTFLYYTEKSHELSVLSRPQLKDPAFGIEAFGIVEV